MNNEWEREFDECYDPPQDYELNKNEYKEDVKSFITSLLASQRADWLKSEIEKLENDKKIEDLSDTQWQAWGCEQIRTERVKRMVYNSALTSIITRYKEELKVLESK